MRTNTIRNTVAVIVLAIASLLGLVSCSMGYKQDNQESSSAPLPEIFNAPNIGGAQATALFKKVVFTLTDGDFVHPKFSPDGNYLAYADVLVVNSTEETQVFLMDLRSGQVRTILSAADARKYITYSVYVTDIEWADNSTLAVYLSDGDVDLVKVMIDSSTGKIISDKYVDDDNTFNVARYGAAKSALVESFPAWPADVLDTGFSNNPIIIPGRGIITQIAYSGYASDILFFDSKNKRVNIVLPMPDHAYTRFVGGAYVSNRAIFTLLAKDYVYLFKLDKDNSVTLVSKYPRGTSDGYISENIQLDTGSLFIMKRFNTYEQGHNPVFYFTTAGQLYELSECADCYDYDATADGRLAVFSSWQNGKRKLTVLRRD